MKHLVYARVSTDKQETSTQIRLAREKLDRMYPNANYEALFFDEGDLSSGVHYLKRPKLQEMLQAISPGDVVIVYLLDRLARDIIEMITIYREIKAKGASLYSLTGEHTDELTMTIMGGIAQHQRKIIQLRTKDKLATKKKKGERYSRFLPLGFKMHETHLVPIRVDDKIVYKLGVLIEESQESKAVEIMYERWDEGASLQTIVNELTRLGYMNRNGNPFHKNTVRRVVLRREKSRLLDQLPTVEESLSFRQ